MEKICHNCEAPFETDIKKKKFCSDNCRVTFSRKKVELDNSPLGAAEPLLPNKCLPNDFIPPLMPYFTPVNQPELDKYGAPKLLTIPEVVQKQKSVKIAGYELPIKEVAGMPDNTFALIKRGTGSKFYEHSESWVKEIEDYCQNAGITPQVLIECHRHQNKAVAAKTPSAASLIFAASERIKGNFPQMSNQALAIRKKKLGLPD